MTRNLSSFFLWALVLAGGGSMFGQPACTPPDSLKTQLHGKPNVDTLNELGVWFGDQKQFDCAANVFATSLQADPQQKNAPYIAFMFGVSLDLSGDTKEAIPALQQSEQLGYRDVKLYAILAQALDETHATKDAEAEWREALEFDPEMSAALDALSNDLLLDKDYAGVIALLAVPRLVGQRTPQQCLNLGAAYAATRKLQEAARVLREGLNTSPDSIAIADRLADILLQLDRREEAIALLKLTVAKHPENADAKTKLVKIFAVGATAK